MKKQTEQKQPVTRDNLYLILLAASVIPLFLIKNNYGKPSIPFFLSLLLFGFNLYIYIKNRLIRKQEISYKIRLITLFSLSASIWIFLDCFFKMFPSVSFDTFILINRLSGSVSDFYSFYAGAISFFLASSVLLIAGLTEFLLSIKRLQLLYITVYIVSISLCLYIVLNYLVLFPGILAAKPEAKLISTDKTIAIDPNQNWDLYMNGLKIELNYDSIAYKWYSNGKYFSNEPVLKINSKGEFYTILTTKYGDIKSMKINIR